MQQYLIGRRLRFSFEVREIDTGVLTDPDNLVLQVKNLRTGVTVTYTYLVDAEFVRTGVGLFYCDDTPTDYGLHAWRVSCTGTVEEATEGQFSIYASNVI